MELSELQLNFLLSMTSNAASGLSGTNLGPKALQLVTQKLNEIGGDWEVVWGPGIYQVRTGVTPTNVMYVAHSPSREEYFVSIAGTNPNSLYSWICQDFYVSKVVAWPYGNAGTGVNISAGTWDGLQALQGMKPEATLPGAGTTLIDFLKSLTLRGKSFKLVTGGHSLGGALSPTACLWLADTATEWDPGYVVSEFQTWPFAGPTAGTQRFANYSNRRIPNTNRTHNLLDIVPHAWEKDTMAELKDVYTPQIPASTPVAAAIRVAQLLPLWHKYTQINNNDNPLDGSIDDSLVGPDPTKNYMVQALYQHVKAYYILLGLESFLPQEVDTSIQAAAKSDTTLLKVRINAYLKQESRLQAELEAHSEDE